MFGDYLVLYSTFDDSCRCAVNATRARSNDEDDVLRRVSEFGVVKVRAYGINEEAFRAVSGGDEEDLSLGDDGAACVR